MVTILFDNCVRENNSKYLFVYSDWIVTSGSFDKIGVSFLPVGHTHYNIDPSFSSTSNRLRHHDEITKEDLQH